MHNVSESWKNKQEFFFLDGFIGQGICTFTWCVSLVFFSLVMCCSSYFFSGCVSYVVLVLVRTLLAVSAWNDNGQTQFVHDSGKSDFGCSRDSWPGIFRIPMLLLLISG